MNSLPPVLAVQRPGISGAILRFDHASNVKADACTEVQGPSNVHGARGLSTVLWLMLVIAGLSLKVYAGLVIMLLWICTELYARLRTIAALCSTDRDEDD